MRYQPNDGAMSWIGPIILINCFVWVVALTPEVNSVICKGSTNCFRDWISALSGWAAAVAAALTILAMRHIHNKNTANDLIKQSLIIRPAAETCDLICEQADALRECVEVFQAEMSPADMVAFRILIRSVDSLEVLLAAPHLHEAERLAAVRPPPVGLRQAALKVTNLKSHHAHVFAIVSEDETKSYLVPSWCTEAKRVSGEVSEFARFFIQDAEVYASALIEGLKRHNPEAIENMEAAKARAKAI